MPLVLVSGFPKEEKLLVCFRKYFNASRITSNYWITDVGDIYNSDLKEITIDFPTFNDALKAEEYINTVSYHTDRGHSYELNAKIIDSEYNNEYGTRSYNNEYEEQHYRRSRSCEFSDEIHLNSRDRSRSPLENTSRIDVEIEILKKKRLLIEEERRLLLEKKKLEMIKEFGVEAYAEINAPETSRFGGGASKLFRANAADIQKEQQDRDRLLRPQWKQDRADMARALPPEKRPLAHIPQFVLPCKIILSQMKNSIKLRAPVLHERNVLTKLIGADLRRRFAIILENKSYMPSDAITKLYRQVYPSSSDGKLIENSLKEVKKGHWPTRKEKTQKNLEKMARKKAAKQKLKAALAGKAGGNKPAGTSTDEVVVVDVKPEPNVKVEDVKPDLQTLATSQVITVPDSPRVKAELNTTVIEEPDVGVEADWAENGVDWNDDDDE